MGSGVSTSTTKITRNNFIFSICIGNGGFSKVSSAMEKMNGKWYAIKEISLKYAIKQKKGLEMIRIELEIMKNIGNHSNISKLHYAFRDYSMCYFVFELLNGADLRYHLRKRHHFSECGIAYIIGCISQALHHIHSKGILHRDVKPENILLDENGIPYLIDYGVSYISHSNKKRPLCYESSGTRQYLAPEIFTRNHEHSIESDFWSLGIVMYELFFHIRPFEKNCPVEYVEYAEIAYERGNRHSQNYLQYDQYDQYNQNNEKNENNEKNQDNDMNNFLQQSNVTENIVNEYKIQSPSSIASTFSPINEDNNNNNQYYKSEQEYLVQRENFISNTLKRYCREIEENPDKCFQLSNDGRDNLVQINETPLITTIPQSPSNLVHPNFNNESNSKFPFNNLSNSIKCTCNNQLYDEIFCLSHSHSHSHSNLHPKKLPNHLRLNIPIESKIYGRLSKECIEVLEGFLDVRLWLRLGAGNNYNKLETHQWFKNHSLNWIFITNAPPSVMNIINYNTNYNYNQSLISNNPTNYEKTINYRYQPCQYEINQDLCAKFLHDSKYHQNEHHNIHNPNWTVEEIQRIDEILENFYYISDEKIKEHMNITSIKNKIELDKYSSYSFNKKKWNVDKSIPSPLSPSLPSLSIKNKLN